MKHLLAIAAAFLVLVTLTVTFGNAQANPPTQYLPQATDTDTPTTTPTFTDTVTPTETVTDTATPSATPTTDPCTVAPPKPQLRSPKRNSNLPSNTVTFRWNALNCIVRYRVTVHRGAKNGPVEWTGGTKGTKKISPPLTLGYRYFWKVRGCTPAACTWSNYWSFTVPSAPPPPPPPDTPTPGPTSPNGTPVPSGSPPSQIAVYKGDGVYLNNISNELYRFSCGPDGWAQFRQGSTMYHIGLWFTPNERIDFSRLDFNTGQIVETGTLYANSDGYVSYATDTSSWTPDHHYHMMFDGETSGIERCGHFDLISNTEPESNVEHAPHTEAEWRLLDLRMHGNR